MLGTYLEMCDRVSLPWKLDQIYQKFDTVYREPGEDPLFGADENVLVEPHVVSDQIQMRYGDKSLEVVKQVEDFCRDISFDDFDGFTVMGGFPGLALFRDRDYGAPKIYSLHEDDSTNDDFSDDSGSSETTI
jgi:hypothetical protein